MTVTDAQINFNDAALVALARLFEAVKELNERLERLEAIAAEPHN